MEFSSPARAVPEASSRLTMLGGFRLYGGDAVIKLPLGAQRVLAFLALHEGPLMRGYVAETLWPDSRKRRAAANLRSAVWRIRQVNLGLIHSTNSHLNLMPGVAVDVREVRVTALRLGQRSSDITSNDLQPAVIQALSMELLPD
jgi:DNA-binding SARP family transcriptional activator